LFSYIYRFESIPLNLSERATLNFAYTKLLWSKIKVKQINHRKFQQFACSTPRWCFKISRYDHRCPK